MGVVEEEVVEETVEETESIGMARISGYSLLILGEAKRLRSSED